MNSADVYIGADPSYGLFLVKCLQSGGLYLASDMAVHPHTFPYRGQSLPQPLRHHHERLKGRAVPESTRSRLKFSLELFQPESSMLRWWWCQKTK